MKNLLTSSLRAATLSVTLLALPLLASAAPADAAAQLLAVTGSVPVKDAGPYVHVGTYQIQVTVKLGRPSATLPDGSWVYHNFSVEDSAAAGSLLVRFNAGRVSELALLSPATVTALMETPRRAHEGILIAAQNRR